MEKKTSGAWVVQHSKKIRAVTGVSPDYQQLEFAGKCGELLSCIAGTSDLILKKDRIEAFAISLGLNKFSDLPAVLDTLERNRFIDRSDDEIQTLGITTEKTLEHINTVFYGLDPNKNEIAAIDLSEQTSMLPIKSSQAEEYISDTYEISATASNDVLNQFKDIKFVDYEKTGNDELLFNGNLFRKQNLNKVNALLNSFTQNDQVKIQEVSKLIDQKGCLTRTETVKITEDSLYQKLIAIGFFDETCVGNEKGKHYFVTKPAAFSKFSDSDVDDAFNLAKAFVTSLTYGMRASESGRGRITMISKLMQKLINGHKVGPATAIGHDYKVLEYRGVIKITPAGGGLYYMELLKRDIGR